MEITKSQEKKFRKEVARENEKIDKELKESGFTRRSGYYKKYMAVDGMGYPKTKVSFKYYCLDRLEGEKAKDIFATSLVNLPKKKQTKEVFGPAMSLWGVSKLKGKKAANKLWKKHHTK